MLLVMGYWQPLDVLRKSFVELTMDFELTLEDLDRFGRLLSNTRNASKVHEFSLNRIASHYAKL